MLYLLSERLYKHVFILGTDGVGTALLNATVPHIGKVIDQGAFTYAGQSVSPTYSAACWTSIIHGVQPHQHGVSSFYFPFQGGWPAPEFPSVFKLVRDQIPGSKMGLFAQWKPIVMNTIEDGLDVKTLVAADDELAEAAVSYIRNECPDFFFLALGEPDEVGHTHGFFGAEHIKSIEHADALIGRIIDEISLLGEDSLIMTITDHGGGARSPTSHGSDLARDKTVFFAAAGPGVPHMELHDVSIIDIPMTAAWGLGVSVPTSWPGKVPFLSNGTGSARLIKDDEHDQSGIYLLTFMAVMIVVFSLIGIMSSQKTADEPEVDDSMPLRNDTPFAETQSDI